MKPDYAFLIASIFEQMSPAERRAMVTFIADVYAGAMAETMDDEEPTPEEAWALNETIRRREDIRIFDELEEEL